MGKHSASFIRNIIQETIPASIYKTKKPKVWEKEMTVTYSRMKGHTNMLAKQNFINILKRLSYYGNTLFAASQKCLPKKVCSFKEIYVGVCADGVKLFDPK